MRFRTTIVLILLLLGLGAYVYWIEMPKAEQEAKKKTLFDFKADDATGITLVYTDREIDLKKSGDEWRLTKPIDVPADAVTVKNLVNAVAECEVKKDLTEPAADLAQYGLDKPLVKVTVTLKDKALPTILVGKNAPVGFSTYIQRDDNKKIQLTSSAFRSGMDKTVKDLRDKTILTFVDKDLQKIGLHGEGKEMTLAQKDDTWNIETPGPYLADATTMRSFLSTLRSMRAVDFPEPSSDPGTYGFDNPRLKVTLSIGKDNAEKTLLLGKETEKKEVYVQASGQPPTVYTVSDWVFRDLNKKLDEFRDKTLLAFDREKLRAVEVQRKDAGTFKLVSPDGKQWKVEGLEGQVVETTVNQFLTDLHDLKGYEIAADHPTDLAQFGLDQPQLKVTVVGGDAGKPVGTILINPRPSTEGKKDFVATAEGGPTVFLIRDYLVTRLNKSAQDFIAKPTPTPGGATPAQLGQPGEAPPMPLGDVDDEGVGDEEQE